MFSLALQCIMYTFLNLSCSEPWSKGRREGELSFDLDHPPAWTRFTWLKRRLTCTNRQTWAARSWSGWGQGQLCHLRNLRWLHQRPGTAEESHAVDSQGSFVFSPLSEDNFFSAGENPPKDDLQSATVELPEVPVPVFHGPRFGAALVGQPRVGHREHAGCRQQGAGQREVSRLWKGLLEFS